MLTLTDVHKSFGRIKAVGGLSLSIGKGEVFGFLGPNGAGKTTTISMAIGLLRPDAGSVTLGGLGPPTDPAVRRHVGVAPQSLALYGMLTAQENLAFFGRLYGLGGRALSSAIGRVLDEVGLSARAKDCVSGFSGGMQRRLNLAAALLHDPPVVLLDEPTAGVDPQSRNNILDLVRQMKNAGRTVVYTTHYMEEAQRLCDRVGVIDHGRLLALGTVDELVAQHGGASTVTLERGERHERRTTADPLRELAGVFAQEQSARNEPLTGVRVERPNLESVFLTLTGRSLRDA
jgi:ABC-2 type transport system ATP-binding protein